MPLYFQYAIHRIVGYPEGIKAVSINVSGAVFSRHGLLLPAPLMPFKGTIRLTAFGYIDPNQ
jgi:hypothetical protein